MTLVDQTLGPSYAAWSGVSSDGSIVIHPDDTDVLVLTLPVAMGPVPLSAPSLFALIYLTWDAVAADGLKTSVKRDRLIAVCRGNATPASVDLFSNFNNAAADIGPSFDLDLQVPFGLRLDAPTALAGYVLPTASINGSGDYELRLRGKSSDGHSNAGVDWVFRNLAASYRVLGAV